MGQRNQSNDDGYSLVSKVLFLTFLLWVGFKAYNYWELKKAADAQAKQSQVRRSGSIPPGTKDSSYAPSQIQQPQPSPAPQTAIPSRNVYRCGNAYSNVPCSGSQTVNVAPPVAYGSSSSAMKEIYLCKDYSGNLTWESVPCSLNGRFMDRIASVPANLPWDQQVAIARQQRSKAQAIAAEQIVPVAPRPSANARSSECQSLEWLIKRLDERCRTSACSMRELDEVREERRKARDRQFRINC